MDWGGTRVVVAALVVGGGFVALMVKCTPVWAKRPRKPTRIRRAKGEYQPPEPPEGRYWG